MVTGFLQALHVVAPGAFLIPLDVLRSIDSRDGSPVLQKSALNSCRALRVLASWVCLCTQHISLYINLPSLAE